MRTPFRLALTAALAAAAVSAAPPADTPAPLLKAVTPPAGGVRVRVPVETGRELTDAVIKARVPLAKKKGEYADVAVSFDTLPGKSAVTLKKWQSWGYDVPSNRVGVLPEIIIPAAQLAPKVSKGGRDADVRIPSVSLDIVEPQGGSDLVFGCDLYLRLNEVTKNADRAFEPRFYFTDLALEFTAPAGSVKRPGTGESPPPEPGVNPDDTLVPVSGPMVSRGTPVFAFASVNGVSQYKRPDGKEETVGIGVSSNSNWPGGIFLTIGAARGCGVEIDNEKDLSSTGVASKGTVAAGKAKEFRLAFQTGPGFKTPKDLVLKDVTVYVDKTNSGHFVWLGTKFVNEHLKDAVYSCGPDGSWRLVGRVKPELLQDVKTRTPAKKP